MAQETPFTPSEHIDNPEIAMVSAEAENAKITDIGELHHLKWGKDLVEQAGKEALEMLERDAQSMSAEDLERLVNYLDNWTYDLSKYSEGVKAGDGHTTNVVTGSNIKELFPLFSPEQRTLVVNSIQQNIQVRNEKLAREQYEKGEMHKVLDPDKIEPRIGSIDRGRGAAAAEHDYQGNSIDYYHGRNSADE